MPAALRPVALLVVSLAVGACGGEAPEAVRPGDVLWTHLDEVRLLRYPATNLPDGLVDPDAEWVRLREPIANARWQDRGPVPPELAAQPTVPEGARMWRAAVAVPLADGGPDPTCLYRGRVVPKWDPAHDPYPEQGLAVWYVREARQFVSIATEPPQNVSYQYLTEAARVFREVELPHVESGRPQRSPRRVPDGLRRRVAFDDDDRDALLLPAPGELSWDIARLEAPAFAVSVGVLDQRWRPIGRALERVREREAAELAQPGAGGREEDLPGDGVVFRLEISVDGLRDVLWTRHLDPGEGWVEGTADVAAWFGEPVTLHLVTDPGGRGDDAFDYAVWGGLRAVGGAAPAREPPRPHVLLVSIDTLRADRVGLYGSARDTTPRFDAWATEHGAAFYRDAWTTAPWTLPATLSLLTGLDVHQHGVDRPARGLADTASSLAGRLREAGYATWGVADGGYTRPEFGTAHGFDRYIARRDEELHAARVADLLADRVPGQPVFLFVQSYMVHSPYRHDPRFLDETSDGGRWAGRDIDHFEVLHPVRRGELELTPSERAYVEALYDAGVARADVALMELIGNVEAAVGDEPLLVVVTSDHGEEFFEHGGTDHGHSLYEELLRVPLVVRFPGGTGPSGPVDAPASLLDVAPTILAAAGVPVPASWSGHRLDRLPDGPRLRLARTEHARAVVHGRHKLIEGPLPSLWTDAERQLYDTEADPAEQVDVLDRDGADPRWDGLAEELRRLAGEHERRWTGPDAGGAQATELADDTRADLEQLGYAGDG